MANSREKLFDSAALCLWVFTSIAFAAYVFIEFGQDFRGYYAAAHVLLERGNPYDYALVARVLVEVTGRAGNNPFYYPLWFGWFVAPFSLLPFQTARLVWMLLNWGLWIVGLLRLQQVIDLPRGWRTWLLCLLATFLFAWTTWKFEQTGVLLFVITVEILISYKREQWNRMGIFMALASIKPNIMLLPMAALGLWLILNRNWGPVRTALIVLFSLIVMTSILTPTWYQSFLRPHFGEGLTEVLNGPNQVTGVRLNTTLLDWLKSFSFPNRVQISLYLTVLVVSPWILWRTIQKSKSILEVLSIALLVSYAITPYALQYDFPPLAIVLFWGLALASSVKGKLTPILIITFITSVLIWERPISDGYWIVIGLILLTFWVEKYAKVTEVSEPSFIHSH